MEIKDATIVFLGICVLALLLDIFLYRDDYHPVKDINISIEGQDTTYIYCTLPTLCIKAKKEIDLEPGQRISIP